MRPFFIRNKILGYEPPVSSITYNFLEETLVPTRGVGAITFTRTGSVGTYFDASGVRQTASTNVPRFDHNPSTLARIGLLVEQNNINNFLNSDAPVTQTITVSSATNIYTVWMEGSGSIVVAAGTAVGTGFGTATVNNPIFLTITTTGTITLTCSGTVTIAQCETGSYQTTYIPTTSVPVARQQDTATVSDVSQFFNPNEGTLFIEAIPDRAGISGSRCVLGFDDGSINNRIYVGQSSTKQARGIITSGGSNTFIASTGSWPDATLARVALSYRNGSYSLCINGSSLLVQQSGALATGINKAGIGNLPSSFGIFNGSIYRARYYNKKLTDAEILRLTA